ncbi:hypothetical protein AB0M95_37270 [Sphaerisporangium sp. NPDC051017]|uniref:hypothetical protein n=1 Tax=Sphaerisporangium sp. NPDC051017 TaxID=3154636 RepID=UPI00343F7715
MGSSGLHIGVVTNGTMIDRHLDEIAEHVTWLRVSVDAATEDTYGRVRPDRKGRSVFGKVIANMRARQREDRNPGILVFVGHALRR